MHRGFSTALTITLMAGVIVLAGVVGYLEYGNSQPATNSPATTTSATSGTSNLVQTTSDELGVSFRHPESWGNFKVDGVMAGFDKPSLTQDFPDQGPAYVRVKVGRPNERGRKEGLPERYQYAGQSLEKACENKAYMSTSSVYEIDIEECFRRTLSSDVTVVQFSGRWQVIPETIIGEPVPQEVTPFEGVILPTQSSKWPGMTMYIENFSTTTSEISQKERIFEKILSSLSYVESINDTENTSYTGKEPVPNSWDAYKNDKWGFALQYPQDVYENFQVENQYSYGNPWSARVTAKKYPAIEISAHRLDEYKFTEPNGQLYSYQLDNKNSWITQIGSEEAYEPPTVSTRSGTAYKFERGVIGETADVYAIPDEAKNVMFTIKFIYNTIQDSDDYTTQTVDQKAVVSSFMSRANGKVIEDTLSTKGIKDQYEDGLAEKIAKKRNKPFIEVSEAKPMDFVRWDYSNNEEKSIAVVNIKSSTDPEKDLVQEVVIFDIGSQNQLSNPQVVWEQSYSTGNDVFWDKVRLSTTTHDGRTVLKNTKQFSNETAKEHHFIHYRNGSFYDAYSLAEVDKQTFLSDINKQYTEELLSDPAFVKEGTSVKGGQKYEVTAENREPIDFARWDHNDDGTKSLAVLNRAGNVFELVLFDINEDKEISNPRRIDERGSATWRWSSADLETVNTYQGKFLRSKILLGNSAPHMNYYSFQDGGFENRGRKTAEVGSECEVGFVYPKGDTVLNQGKRYEVRWKDLFNDVSRTGINPAVSRRDIKIINEDKDVIGKLKTAYGLGNAAEWQSLRVLDLDGDSLTDEGRLVEPGKYKLRADYYYSQKARDRLQNNGCDLSDKKANDTHYENVFESEWFRIEK